MAVTSVKLFVGLRARMKKNRSRPTSQRRKSAFGAPHGARRPGRMVHPVSTAIGSPVIPMFRSGIKPGSLSKYSASNRMMLSIGSRKNESAIPNTEVRSWIVEVTNSCRLASVRTRPRATGTGWLGKCV